MNGNPFSSPSWVRSDRTIEGEAVLFRDDVEIARRKQTFPGGSNATDV